MDSVLFFGYDIHREGSLISQIIGRHPNGIAAIIQGYTLCSQRLDQVPNPAQGILRSVFGDSFQSYTLRKGNGIVLGTIWELTDEDLSKIKEFEFEGVWREFFEVEVLSSGMKNVRCITEKVYDNQEILEVVDGLDYDLFLNKKSEQVNSEQLQKYTTDQIEQIKNWLKTEKIQTSIPSSPTQPSTPTVHTPQIEILNKPPQ
jgi:hypothetical protein